MITYKGWHPALITSDVKVHRFEDMDDGTIGSSFLDPGPSQEIVNHSPDGFQWGYRGSGPAQLALALVLDATGDKNRAQRVYQDFKEEFVALWGNQWQITQAEIVVWVNCHPRVQCTSLCERARKDYASATMSEGDYAMAMCDIHFAEYQDRIEEAA